MGDYQAITPKYIIYASFEIEGVVEDSDVVGALFGQTEGLFGSDLDLRELQKAGRIGRILIKLESKQDRTKGQIIIPSSTDKPSTALMAAAVESVDRVGPCASKIILERIEDVREVKRSQIVARAKEVLHKWTVEATPNTEEVLQQISNAVIPNDVSSFGPEKLSSGPNVSSSNSIIIVEGRADVANLLRSGIKNIIACEGAKIPETIINLSKEKKITAFLDGDRGGDLILKGLMQVADIAYIAKAPRGKEVEELTPAEIFNALKNKVRFKKEKSIESPEKLVEKTVMISDVIKSSISDVKGNLEAVFLDKNEKQIERVPVSELCEKLQKTDDTPQTIVFDGIITQRLVDIAFDKGVKKIIGERISGVTKRPINLQLMTANDVT